jgi:hypothetical protein
MIYEFVMMKDRVPYLVNELGDKVTVGEDYKEDMSIVHVNVERGSDLVNIFHAGIRLGLDAMNKKD